MKWKNIKFWCWLEVDFPSSSNQLAPIDMDLLPDVEPLDVFGAAPGAQGAQGAQFTCGEPPAGQTVCFDILAFNSEFELNSIPSAQVAVALGRRADDVSVASEIHYWIDDLKLQLPARVWCQAMTGDSSSGKAAVANEWPAAAFKIFDGYATGSGMRYSTTGAELNLALTHWLTDLNFSSAVSKQSHPLNPAQLYQPANFTTSEIETGSGLVGTVTGMVTPFMALPFFDTNTIVTDFWGGTTNVTTALAGANGFKAWLQSLTQLDRINSDEILNLGGNASYLPAIINSEACRALARFEPNAVTPDVSETGYVLGVPLALGDNGDLNYYIALAISDEIGHETLDAYRTITLWDKLSGDMHANYMYSVVPLVDKALVVPFIPGLSSGSNQNLVHRIIQTSDYDSIDLQAVMPRPLRAVGIVMGARFEAGGTTADLPAQYPSFGGWFDKMAAPNDLILNPGGNPPPNTIDYREGLVLFRSAPTWMTGIVTHYLNTPGSTGYTETQRTPVNTDGGSAPTTTDLRTRFQQMGPVWDLYARGVYMYEVLKNRQGIITGPVRFDIAPGSQVQIEATEDMFVKQVVFNNIAPDQECSEQYSKYYWASVIRVSTTIDCQNMRAFTSFYVAHVRDSNENNDVGTAIAAHPLWQQASWAGAALVQDSAFAPLSTVQYNGA